MTRSNYTIMSMDKYISPQMLADVLIAAKVDIGKAGIYPKFIELVDISWDNMINDLKSISRENEGTRIMVTEEAPEDNINHFFFKDGKAYFDIEDTGYQECLLNDNEDGIMPTYKTLEWSESSFFSTKECNPPAGLLVLAVNEWSNPLVCKRGEDGEWTNDVSIKYWRFI